MANQAEAAEIVGASADAVGRWWREAQERKDQRAHLNGPARKALREGTTEGVVKPFHHSELKAEPRRALEDFALFRRRYFGRVSTPWQEAAAYAMLAFLETPEKEFVVVNCPPGSGKSTLFTHDIPAWLTCRNRSIRGVLGSTSQPLAARYLRRLMASFEATSPLKCPDDERRLGVAHDAWATLAADYGPFKPGKATTWSASAMLVAQAPDRMQGEKEPTWTAVGIESKYIGGRFNVCVWDDVVDPRSVMSVNETLVLQQDWDSVAEKRLEPGGVLVLQGQRLDPSDIYHYNLAKEMGEDVEMPHEGCCSAPPGRKYHHIVYRAHDDEHCDGEHTAEAKAWPEGCLLDPRRLPWRELATEMRNDMSRYLQVYQQQDADLEDSLVKDIWVAGGTDADGSYPGCWDWRRDLCELPEGLSAKMASLVTVDVSPTQFWAVQWWVVVEPAVGQGAPYWYLMDLEGRKMQSGQFLDYDTRTGAHTGLMEEWMARSWQMKVPIRFVVVEINAAQRFLFQYQHVREWQARWRAQIVPHTTGRNKSDPQLGVGQLGHLFRNGLVRFPGLPSSQQARWKSLRLIDEAKKWRPGAKTRDDQVMAFWFGVFNYPRLRHSGSALPALGGAPSWLADAI